MKCSHTGSVVRQMLGLSFAYINSFNCKYSPNNSTFCATPQSIRLYLLGEKAVEQKEENPLAAGHLSGCTRGHRPHSGHRIPRHDNRHSSLCGQKGEAWAHKEPHFFLFGFFFGGGISKSVNFWAPSIRSIIATRAKTSLSTRGTW